VCKNVHCVLHVIVQTVSEEHLATVQALTEALSLGYVRFLDFQQVEQQNHELTITNALERVRSQALSMQTTDDLPSVSGAVFREIQNLDIKAINTAIGVIDEERDHVSQWRPTRLRAP
jgi:hypothetical protein